MSARVIVLLLGLMLGLSACGSNDDAHAEAGDEHGHEVEEFERGPHGGRLLRDGPFALELKIFEEGVPPEFHVYLFRDDKPLTPEAAQVQVEVARLDGEVN